MKSSKTVIVILGGWIAKDQKGSWHTADQYEGYNQFGITGHRIRVLAGKYLYDEHPDAVLIASGGTGKLNNQEDAPTVSSVIKAELADLGVPESSILEESLSGNTYQQLAELTKMVEQENISKVWLVSNTYHIPRIEALVKLRPELRASAYQVISADEVVSKKDEHLRSIIEKVYETVEMREHIQLEKQGISDLETGKYRF